MIGPGPDRGSASTGRTGAGGAEFLAVGGAIAPPTAKNCRHDRRDRAPPGPPGVGRAVALARRHAEPPGGGTGAGGGTRQRGLGGVQRRCRRPTYSPEWTDGAWEVLRHYLVPLVLGGPLRGSAVAPGLSPIQGNHMAKAAIESAVLDAELRASGESLAHRLGGTRDRVVAGVAIGLTGSLPELVDQVERRVAQGYRRVKLKIHPGWDVEPVLAVRERFSELQLMADANGTYTVADAAHLRHTGPGRSAVPGTAPGQRRPARPRRAGPPAANPVVPGRIDHLRCLGRGRHRARRLPGGQHQAGTGRRLSGGGAHPRSVPGCGPYRCGAEACSRPG